jgi:replicative DNA helicase
MTDYADKLPPHDEDAERGVLGCLLVAAQDVAHECIAALPMGPKAFYALKHQSLYAVLVEMADACEPIDTITVTSKLRDAKKLEEVGGLPYVASLGEAFISAANVSAYLKIVKQKYIRRALMSACIEVARLAQYDTETPDDELLGRVEQTIFSVSQERSSAVAPQCADLVRKTIDQIEEYWNAARDGGNGIIGIPTGFSDFDRMTRGMKGAEMIVFAGRPGTGKTSFAMCIADNAAVTQRIPVGVFSLEMSDKALMTRLICARARINLVTVLDGKLTERDFPKMTRAAAEIRGAPLHIDDSTGLTILELRAKARRMAALFGIKLFVIDYLQLLHSSSKRAENRQQEIADISNGCKELAKELDLPVIVLAQLNREMEREKARKPRMSDLRESGAIEQDADLIGMLYQPNPEDEATRDERSALQVNLGIVKQRNGPVGDVEFTFLKGYTRFESLSKFQAPNDEPPQPYKD